MTSSIDLPRPLLQSVDSIKYIDTAGILRTLPPETYVVDASSNEMGRVSLAGTGSGISQDTPSRQS